VNAEDRAALGAFKLSNRFRVGIGADEIERDKDRVHDVLRPDLRKDSPFSHADDSVKGCRVAPPN
jgi:hypothetical protein